MTESFESYLEQFELTGFSAAPMSGFLKRPSSRSSQGSRGSRGRSTRRGSRSAAAGRPPTGRRPNSGPGRTRTQEEKNRRFGVSPSMPKRPASADRVLDLGPPGGDDYDHDMEPLIAPLVFSKW